MYSYLGGLDSLSLKDSRGGEEPAGVELGFRKQLHSQVQRGNESVTIGNFEHRSNPCRPKGDSYRAAATGLEID
jgi:hypothetical protein